MQEKERYRRFLETIYQRHSGNVKLGLDRIEAILDRMGCPHLKLTGIHIAGTNGKGSTAAMCEAIALAHGQRTGLNTSPHLVDYRERIRLDGEYIQPAILMAAYEKWVDQFEKYEASFFEITTSLAFHIFHQEQVETAVFEVGLGGRLDGTNPFASTVCAITSISIDHPKSLGDTIEKIAAEKAGIIKPDVPVVTGRMPAEALEVIQTHAKSKNAPVYRAGEEFSVDFKYGSLEGTTFDLQIPGYEFHDLRTNLIGEHQARNAGVAVMSWLLYCERTGIPFVPEQVRKGLNRVWWLGRMQILGKNPLIILDGAHNQEGIDELVTSIRKLFPSNRILTVLAILRDKKLDEMIETLCSISHKMYISKNKSNRAAEIQDQVDAVLDSGTPLETAFDVTGAISLALNEADVDDVILITGSLYTIAEAIPYFTREEIIYVNKPQTP